MNSRNRITGMLIAFIFMMVLPSCAFADSASDYSKHHEKDLLKDAASDADSHNSAMWGDAVLPVQVCAPRVSRTIVSFEPSPFNAHFIALNDNYSITLLCDSVEAYSVLESLFPLTHKEFNNKEFNNRLKTKRFYGKD